MGDRMKPRYHGWLVVQKEPSYMGKFYAEYSGEAPGERKRVYFQSPSEAVEWWDARVGKPVKLESTPLGAYRVYTEEEGPLS